VIAPLLILAGLLFGHAVGDYLLQPPWFALMKRNKEADVRWGALAMHGWIHALPVAIVTGSPVLAVVELVVHPLIDRGKGRGWYGLWIDQLLHVGCKLLWTFLIVCFS
jgi:hypothetical protein